MKLDKIESPDQFIATVSAAVNIAEMLTKERLARIGSDVVQDFTLDYDSMADWRERMDRGIKLAKLVKEDKNYPFKNASNVKYPLITSAALQFNARAYPAIVPSEQLVKVKTFGSDPEGAKAARAERVSNHMSWQLIHKIEEWEEETDKLLVQLPIVGTMVRKVWYDSAQERIRCRVIDAGSFIVNDKAKNLGDAPRVSEEMPLYPHEFRERMAAGLFLDVDLEIEDGDDSKAAETFIEQHTRLDLDSDGYEEPYIVTVHKKSQKVVRIVADFEDRDVTFLTEQVMVPQKDPYTFEVMEVPAEMPTAVKSIRRGSYFVPYHFLPSLDGGFHGTGLGLLLGDISDTINSIINMMMDAGHMSSLGGGFIGSDFRIKGGSQRFQPGEWKRSQATGGTIRDSMVPMTFPGPDNTLFQMLGMLIDAGREIASVKDIMTGDSGQQKQTATTTIALIEQGMMVFTAAYKRIFRALKREYKMIADINAETVGVEEYNAFQDPAPQLDQAGQPMVDPMTGQPMIQQFDPAQDYSGADMDIAPVADPRSVTKMQEAAKAQFLMGLAEQGMVDSAEAAERMMQAMDISERQALIPEPDPMQAQMAQMQMQLEQAKTQADAMKAEADQTKAQAEMIKAQTPVDSSADVLRTQTDERVKIAEMEIKAQLEREKMAQDVMIEREKMIADLQARQLELQAQMATSQQQGEGEQQQGADISAIVAQFGEMIAAIQAQTAMANAPKEVVRDADGRVAGVRPVLN